MKTDNRVGALLDNCRLACHSLLSVDCTVGQTVLESIPDLATSRAIAVQLGSILTSVALGCSEVVTVDTLVGLTPLGSFSSLSTSLLRVRFWALKRPMSRLATPPTGVSLATVSLRL